jgi:undecaprenyl-diphosphatase
MVKYIFLGLVQGLTEFLPVSSSGHLVILEHLLGIRENGLALSIVLHLGTGVSVIIFFFKDILEALRNFKLVLMLALATVITVAIGLLGNDFFESLFDSPAKVAGGLVVTGVLLISTRKFMHGKKRQVGFLDSVIFGFSQGAAIIPGISRAGSTISVLLFRGVDIDSSFKFSFLASIPVIFGAALFEAKKIDFALTLAPADLVAGFLSSLFTGLFALWALRLVLHRARLYYFGYYCIIVAIVTLLFVK